MKKKIIFECSECNHQTPKWNGQCPSCFQWNTMEEKEVKKNRSGNKLQVVQTTKEAQKLKEVKDSRSDRIVTGISEFNRVMGGGMVKDSVLIMTSPPGGGKSTLSLEIANDAAHQGYRVMYASGEESESQIKNRANRILPEIDENLWILSDNSMENVVEQIEKIDAQLVIIDSIQTFAFESIESRPGSPTQTMECASVLQKMAKNSDSKRAVILIGQMTKEDELAGMRALEHLVDTVLIIDSDKGEELRGVYCSKNRFGSTGEMGFFAMTEGGMVSIDNPSEYFMTMRSTEEKVSGSALTVVKEGTRPVIVEIESLVSQTFMPYPSRIGECLRKEQLNTLLSILEQRASMPLHDKNVVIKTTGGFKLREAAVNLAIIMSTVSSILDQGIANDVAFIADVGLTGELKRIPSMESRIRELNRMGFKKVYIAQNSITDTIRVEGLEIIESKALIDVVKKVFGPKA
ncbi:DNA repair protein RadA [Tindallia californiensis]|uniref:DNA repair protein RadA n=1 Tax=Tindallia californiensis TaxID=159292 RepID=A0A1H3R930_9FIRM|nr:DNA repair protein RadA [Tindallia californiensis]SDZ22116.1 DNA repair protein RadA/Sms [Tindallia californiensis]